MKDFKEGKSRKPFTPYSEQRLLQQEVQIYQSQKLGSDKNTHAVALARTIKSNSDRGITLGLYDNGRTKVTEFSVENFQQSLQRFWDCWFFDIVP